MKPITIVAIIVLLAAGCSKNNATPLPPATQTGANTFGCSVNGTAYTAYGNVRSLLNDGLISFYVNAPDSTLHISAKNTKAPAFDLELIIPYTGQTGMYLLSPAPFGGTFDENSPDGSYNRYITTESNTGSVAITYFNTSTSAGYTQTILAGTFRMDAVNSEGNPIHITDGRFDIAQ